MRVGCSALTFLPLTATDPLRVTASVAMELLARSEFDVVNLVAGPDELFHIDTRNQSSQQAALLAAMAVDLGLEIDAIQTALPRDIDLTELQNQASVAADAAAALGARVWIYFGLPASSDRQADLRQFAQTISVLHELACERQLLLAVEAPHRATIAERYEEIAPMLAVADDMGVPLGLDFDTSHIHNTGATSRIIAEYASRIAHVAIRDTVGPDQWAMGLGQGDVDFDSFISDLRGVGWNGDLMLELEPEGAPIAERISMIEQGRAFLERVIETSARKQVEGWP